MEERLAFNYGVLRPSVPEAHAERPAEERAAQAPGEETAARPRRDWAYFWLLAFTALVFFRPQDDIRPLEYVHLAEITAICGLAALFTARLTRGLSITKTTIELYALLAFGGAVALSVPFSFWPGGSFQTLTGDFLKSVLIFVLMINTLSTPKRIDRLLWLIVLASGVIATRAAIDYVRGVNLVENGRVRGALGGIFGNPNDLALNLVVFLSPAISFAVRPGRAARRLIAAGCVLVMIAAITFTKSRAGMLGLAVMLAVVLFYGRRLRPGTIAVAFVLMLGAVPLLPHGFWVRMQSIVDESQDKSGSREARRELLDEAWKTFLAHPLTGIGANQFKNYNPPGRKQPWRVTHNVVLQVAAETGIVGLVTFLFMIACAVVAAHRAYWWSRRRRPGGRLTTVVGLSGMPSPSVSANGMRAKAPEDADQALLRDIGAALVASLAGWMVCAFFASVAFNWTIYLLLGLATAAKELARERYRPRRRQPLVAMREA